MKIIFFDGLCPMCHSWIKRIIRWDRKKIFQFAPLEGETASRTLKDIFPNYLAEDTIIYYEDGKIYTRSTAAIHIIEQLGLPWSLITSGRIVPRFLRDAIYRMVANRRYRFGKRYDSCPLPPIEWRGRFLP